MTSEAEPDLAAWAPGQVRNCATVDYLQVQQQKDLNLQFRMEAIERFTQEFNRCQGRAVSGVITIPVVMHVVYNTSAENINDAQILSQMTILNDDFRRLNSDADNVWPQAADTEFEFCLATRDPSGLPTSGITRTATSKTSFSIFFDDVKFDATGGKDAWPADSYLNIWVCNLADYLGYATFPGGDPAIDGIVCLYGAFGDTGTVSPPFDLGRTTTHEAGHWLNLSHIWGDGGCSFDDFIADTPSSDAANFGCAIGHISCSTEDMVQNYMDYSDDACIKPDLRSLALGQIVEAVILMHGRFWAFQNLPDQHILTTFGDDVLAGITPGLCFAQNQMCVSIARVGSGKRRSSSSFRTTHRLDSTTCTGQGA